MASYPITYTCGHTGEANLTGTDRQRRLAWIAKGKCPKCDRADQEAMGPYMRVCLCGPINTRPGRFIVALSDAYPIRDALKARGWRWDDAPVDLGGVIEAVLSIRKPDGVWRKDWPLTDEGAAACRTEADGLLADGVVAQDRVAWMDGDRLSLEIGFTQTLNAERRRSEREAAVNAAAQADARSTAAAAAYRVAPGRRALEDGKTLPVWLVYLGSPDPAAIVAIETLRAARWVKELRAWSVPQRDVWQDDLVAIVEAARERALARAQTDRPA